MKTDIITFIVENPLHEGLRVDAVLSMVEQGLTRSQIKQRCKAVRVNKKSVKLSHQLRLGDLIEAELVELNPPNLEPQDIDIQVLYEDDKVIVLNKPQGLVVHPGAGHHPHTLVQGLLYHHKVSQESDPLRPGIVHRLDKDTSGVIIVAKDSYTHAMLSDQFKNRRVEKLYLAILHKPRDPKSPLLTMPETEWYSVRNRIGRDPLNRKRFAVVESDSEASTGRLAVTHFRIRGGSPTSLLAQIKIETGRTHQIRVHSAFLGASVVGDTLYGAKNRDDTLMLHAYRLRITLPNETIPREFEAPIPDRFIRYMEGW
ncbi:RluA family pseudouridine synthase [Spirochaeta lutea]|uniref:RluA family pseudouridine synthase n=1 Tax=Spirochaeta lutea TaxID=1480694 RepID=UPI0005649D86|nr:RluA family pseudouridine synthase [Spirochaeta lutea]